MFTLISTTRLSGSFASTVTSAIDHEGGTWTIIQGEENDIVVTPTGGHLDPVATPPAWDRTVAFLAWFRAEIVGVAL